MSIHGMTTAATICVNAAIGMAAGAGEFAIATTATVLTIRRARGVAADRGVLRAPRRTSR